MMEDHHTVSKCLSKLSDRDHCAVSKYLLKLGKSDLKSLFQALGLYNSTIDNYCGETLSEFCDYLIRNWMNGKDGTLQYGRASWSSLVVALRKEGQMGIANDIEDEQTGVGQEEQAGPQVDAMRSVLDSDPPSDNQIQESSAFFSAPYEDATSLRMWCSNDDQSTQPSGGVLKSEKTDADSHKFHGSTPNPQHGQGNSKFPVSCPKPLSDPPRFEDLMDEVAAALPKKWEDVATKLGLPQTEIECIDTIQNPTPNRYYRRVFNYWEKNTPNCKSYCWATVIEALKSPMVNEHGLACKLESRIR